MSNEDKYYDKVDEKAYEQSRKNTSVPTEDSRALWQSTNVSTDGSGPTTADVSPIFAQARADALRNPASAAGDVDEDQRAENEDSANAAQEEADRIREAPGYAAPTDDENLEGSVPKKNFSAEPERSDEERDSKAVAKEEKAKSAGARNVSTDETEQQAPKKETSSSSSRSRSTKSDEKK
jgi:hypothetical protein